MEQKLQRAKASDLAHWLTRSIGKRLLGVEASVYVTDDGEEEPEPQELALNFDVSPLGRLKTFADGESLVWDKTNLSSFDMDEFGSFRVVDLSAKGFWRSFVGKTLDAGRIIHDRADIEIGIELFFGKKVVLYVVNCGDELRVFDELPEWLIDSGEV